MVLVEVVGASDGCDKAATVVVVASTLSKSREKNRQPTISLYRPALASLAGHCQMIAKRRCVCRLILYVRHGRILETKTRGHCTLVAEYSATQSGALQGM